MNSYLAKQIKLINVSNTSFTFVWDIKSVKRRKTQTVVRSRVKSDNLFQYWPGKMDVSKVLGIASHEMMIGDLPKTAAGSQRSIWKKKKIRKQN